MQIRLSRRTFTMAAASAPWLIQGTLHGAEKSPTPAKPAPLMDIHVHLFGTGDSGSGCRLSKRLLESPLFQLLTQNIRKLAPTLDEAYVAALAAQVKTSGLDKAVLLAQDAIYDHGKPDWEKTDCYVPNDYVLQVAARFPKQMVPCVSINPDRADCVEELERCCEKGARVLKIHPPIQGVDLADKKYRPFFRRAADRKVVVMVHTGHEHSCPIFDPRLGSPSKLIPALEEGCTVVACHCGTGRAGDKPDMLPEFLAMVRKHKNLWGDTAVLGSALRTGDFARLLADKPAVERLVHGSDYPFPPGPLAFAPTIGMAEATRLQKMSNMLQQDFGLKQALGVGRASAERAFKLVCGEV